MVTAWTGLTVVWTGLTVVGLLVYIVNFNYISAISELPDLVGEEIVDSYNKLTSETPGSFVGISSDG
jgi:hypothetical protein